MLYNDKRIHVSSGTLGFFTKKIVYAICLKIKRIKYFLIHYLEIIKSFLSDISFNFLICFYFYILYAYTVLAGISAAIVYSRVYIQKPDCATKID